MSELDRMPLRTDAELQTAWRRLISPLGFRRRSLWLLPTSADDRPCGPVVEVADLPAAPGAAEAAGLAAMLAHGGDEGTGRLRWAILLSRPGSHGPDEADLRWADALYVALREGSVDHRVIHLATDLTIVAMTPSDVAGHRRAS